MPPQPASSKDGAGRSDRSGSLRLRADPPPVSPAAMWVTVSPVSTKVRVTSTDVEFQRMRIGRSPVLRNRCATPTGTKGGP
jgi:hypothetical protein